MPKTPAWNQNIGMYLSGYADGEGSFCVSFSPRPKLKTRVEVRPSFSVSQNGDRREVLDLFVEYFHCGTIRKNSSDKTYKYEVRSLGDLERIIIPHFYAFPLLSAKQKDFEKFAIICGLMTIKKHTSSVTLKEILDIAFTMNASGIRKFTKETLLHLMT